MELKKEKILEIINQSKDPGEALIGLYQTVFPDWEKIKKIHGWPRVGQDAFNLIAVQFKKKFGIESLLLLINKGFGMLERPGYDVSLEDVEVEYLPTH